MKKISKELIRQLKRIVLLRKPMRRQKKSELRLKQLNVLRQKLGKLEKKLRQRHKLQQKKPLTKKPQTKKLQQKKLQKRKLLTRKLLTRKPLTRKPLINLLPNRLNELERYSAAVSSKITSY